MEKKEALVTYQEQRTKQRDSFVKYCETKNESDIIHSIFSPNIIKANDKEFFNQMIDLVAKWRWMVGANNTTNEDELAGELLVISKFIISNYGTLTTDEINLAINLSLTDKLDCDVKTYGNFSPMYVSRILNAYVSYKNKIAQDVIKRKVSNERKAASEKKATPEEKMKGVIELIEYLHQEYQAKGELNDYFSTLYNFFRRIGLLNPDKQMVDDAMAYGKSKAEAETLNDFTSKMIRVNKDSSQKTYARNYCVMRLFDSRSLEYIISKVELKHFQ